MARPGCALAVFDNQNLKLPESKKKRASVNKNSKTTRIKFNQFM